MFFGGQTTQKPKKYDRPEATANAAISARLPYIMATSRFAHYLKVMARDKIGSFMEASDVRGLAEPLDQELRQRQRERRARRRRPSTRSREAKVEVKEIPGKPGSYNAVAWLRPWLQFEELTTSLRMVASIPKSAAERPAAGCRRRHVGTGSDSPSVRPASSVRHPALDAALAGLRPSLDRESAGRRRLDPEPPRPGW